MPILPGELSAPAFRCWDNADNIEPELLYEGAAAILRAAGEENKWSGTRLKQWKLKPGVYWAVRTSAGLFQKAWMETQGYFLREVAGQIMGLPQARVLAKFNVVRFVVQKTTIAAAHWIWQEKFTPYDPDGPSWMVQARQATLGSDWTEAKLYNGGLAQTHYMGWSDIDTGRLIDWSLPVELSDDSEDEEV